MYKGSRVWEYGRSHGYMRGVGATVFSLKNPKLLLWEGYRHASLLALVGTEGCASRRGWDDQNGVYRHKYSLET